MEEEHSNGRRAFQWKKNVQKRKHLWQASFDKTFLSKYLFLEDAREKMPIMSGGGYSDG